MFTIDMRTIATFVMRNEEHRYLNACLKWTSQFVDDIFVFDDQSTDDSVAIARQYGPVAVRHGSTASFLQNESEFREAAWMTMQNTLEPERGDIILALDTDEFVIMNGFNLTLEIGEVLQVPIHEVFGVKENVPMIRTDGYWGGISGQRVLVYDNNEAIFANRRMGCGSLPITAVVPSKKPVEGISILHYGYCRAEDRRQKYERYKGLPGHSAAHIESILQTPKLEEWRGVRPRL